MKTILILGLAVAAISFTITVTSIFLSFREWFSKFHHKLEELIHCPWCLSHYIAFPLVMYFVGSKESTFMENFFYFIIYYFATIAIAGLCHSILLTAYEPIQKNMVRRQIDKLKNAKARED